MAPEWASSGVPLVIFLFFVVLGRSQATYWLGRLAAAGAIAGSGRGGLWEKIAAWFNGPIPRKGAGLLEKWGIVIIPLCFLTVGLQTAVIAGAGLVRLRWAVYTLASIPGCIAWALLYGLGLLAVWTAAIAAIAGNPWAWAIILTVIGGAGIALALRRKRGLLSPSDEGGA